MNDDIRISPTLTIPDIELEWSFQTSGGPGGQHANRTASAAALTWDFGESKVLTEEQRGLLRQALGARGASGSIRVVADRSRSQWRNREEARERLARVVRDALTVPPARRATRPTAASRQRRLEAKRRRSETKRRRRRPDSTDRISVNRWRAAPLAAWRRRPAEA